MQFGLLQVKKLSKLVVPIVVQRERRCDRALIEWDVSFDSTTFISKTIHLAPILLAPLAC